MHCSGHHLVLLPEAEDAEVLPPTGTRRPAVACAACRRRRIVMSAAEVTSESEEAPLLQARAVWEMNPPI